MDYQGSRQIDSFTRRYYEKELGADVGPSPSMKEHFGYTEPFRRFVQHETFSPQANEIPNTAASWLPGDDYYVNFHEGDPFIKVDEVYAQVSSSRRTHNTSRARAGSPLPPLTCAPPARTRASRITRWQALDDLLSIGPL